MEEVEILERLDFHDFKISVKSSSVPVMIEAYRRLADARRLPAAPRRDRGRAPCSPAREVLARHRRPAGRGIGDTIRVSLTTDPVEEVRVGFEILKALGLRQRGPELIACPSCGRTNVEVHELAERVERRLGGYREHFEVAVMGCAVNGPGEAGDADFGIAGGRDAAFVYAHGEVLRRCRRSSSSTTLFAEIDRWIADGMPRPERGSASGR